MKFTYGKEEKLKSKKLIEQLFLEGRSVTAFPLRMVYLKTPHTSLYPVQSGVSVSKRKFKYAVERNRIKRLMREAFRKNKQTLYASVEGQYICMIIYLDNKEWKYDTLEEKMQKLFAKFKESIK